jgi:predicted nucleotidyltransferase
VNIDLDNAIVKALAYADLFDQALSTEELYQRLSRASVTMGDIEQREQDMLRGDEKIQDTRYKIQNGVWFLVGRDELVRLKNIQRRTAREKLKVAWRWSWMFKLLPWVKLVAVSGSVAGGSPKAEDDIDIVVITESHRVWLSRLLLIAIFSLLGKRRRPTDDPAKVNNKLCLNMWLTEDRLASEDRDIYVAHELMQLVPIVNRHQMLERYWAANEWVRKFLPNAQLAELSVEKVKIETGGLRLLDWLDHWAEKWQRERMRVVTKERVEEDLLMFHPRDYRTEVLDKYANRLEILGLDSDL